MAREIAVGDPVLWYGLNLNVTALVTHESGVAQVEVADTAGLKKREEAYEKVREIRAKQRDPQTSKTEHEQLAAEIEQLDVAAREAIVRAKLRADLLSFWEERGVWVSDGRILSDAQQEAFKKVTGHKVTPEAQRAALSFIESAEG